MKKLNNLGIGILLGVFLVNSINEKDFENIKEKIKNKTNQTFPTLSQHFYDLNRIVSKEDEPIIDKIYEQKILNKLEEIKNEIKEINSEEVAQLIINELNNDGGNDE